MKDQASRPPKQIAKGIITIIIACFFNAIQVLFVKLSSDKMDAIFLVPFRMGFNLCALIVFLLIKNRFGDQWRTLLTTNKLRLHVLRACSGIFSVYAFYLGIIYLNLVTATLIFFSFPLFIPFVAYIWSGVQLFHNIWWGLIIAFAGLVVALNIGPFFSPLMLIPLAGSIVAAVGVISVRKLQYTESTLKIIMYFYGFGFLLSLIVYLMAHYVGYHTHINLTPKMMFYLAMIGISSTFYIFFMTTALKFAPARFLTPFFYFIILFGMVFDYWIIGNVPSITTYIGAGMIVFGILLLTLMYPKEDYKVKK